MDESEQRNRVEALSNAVRYKLTGAETADDIVTSAKKYFAFLQAEGENE